MANAVELRLNNFTVGCDPELFVVNDKGEFVCADGLIPGSKEEPFKVEGGAVQVDGMAAEFNIDPVSNFKDFRDNINMVMTQLREMLPEGYSLKVVPAVEFSKEVWDAAPDRAKMLGCSPDYNAWTGGVNSPPECRERPRLRTASGHLHIGWRDDGSLGDETHLGHCRDLVKQLDYYLGGWSLSADKDPTRRLLYGKAGACRYKTYGVEYRVLSNFWLKSQTSMLHVWNRLARGINDMRDDYLPENGSIKSKFGQPFTFNELLIKSIDESKMDPNLAESYYFPLQSL